MEDSEGAVGVDPGLGLVAVAVLAEDVRHRRRAKADPSGGVAKRLLGPDR